MFTRTRELDMYVMLPFLDHHDIHCVVQTNKQAKKEFHERLMNIKRGTFLPIEHLHVSEFANVNYALCVDNKRQDTQEIRMIELCTDTLGSRYMKLYHSNGITITTIYSREFRFQGEDTVLYRIDKRYLKTT